MSTTFALLGPPNSGKSSLFNALTGKNQKIANYPGVTVESAVGQISENITLIDLPGIYGLKAYSVDERISRDYILKNGENRFLHKFSSGELDYHTLIVVADASQLKRSLYLCLELIKLNLPILLVLNRTDIAKKRQQVINTVRLQELLGIPVIETSCFDKLSIERLKMKVEEMAQSQITPTTPPSVRELHQIIQKTDWSQKTYRKIDEILSESVEREILPDTVVEKLDKFLIHPLWGMVALLGVLYIVFQTLFTISGPFQDGITFLFDSLGAYVSELTIPTALKSLLVDGIIAGIGGILVFLPQILFLYFFLGILEDSGYMARVAYLLDSYMARLGLPGKSVIPLLSSHACAIPGIMSIRTLSNNRDRIVTMLLAPIMTCSARLPVYTLLLATFLPLKFQGFGLLLLYMASILTSFVVAFALKFILPPENAQYLLLDLPHYQIPQMKLLLQNVLRKAKLFIKKAGTIILGLTVVLWFLSYFPRPETPETPHNIEESYAGTIGRTFQPIFAPLGFDSKMTTALIPSFAAREIMVATMGTVLAIEDAESDSGIAELQDKIKTLYPISSIIALLVWFIFAPQCIATFAVLKKETVSYKWPFITFGYTLALAYSLSFVAHQMAIFFIS
ncbi:MAG: ferrous iron transporter B [Halobacteriovoraceae bacterium]|nr:ferrous iron transporter B [Halobacteriovoraceae bacterium]MCB9093804.1 ferrous iron transporter B [Halobacteriovoraceae bacterium]